jgi:hypothetical protein
VARVAARSVGAVASLEVVRGGLDNSSTLTGGGSPILDGGEGCSQVGQSNARGGRCDGDGVGVDG